jgi:hypothetical protein
MSHTIARNEGVEGDMQIMRMPYEPAGFDLTGEEDYFQEMPAVHYESLSRKRARFHGLNEILHDERYE